MSTLKLQDATGPPAPPAQMMPPALLSPPPSQRPRISKEHTWEVAARAVREETTWVASSYPLPNAGPRQSETEMLA